MLLDDARPQGVTIKNVVYILHIEPNKTKQILRRFTSEYGYARKFKSLKDYRVSYYVITEKGYAELQKRKREVRKRY